MRHFLRGTMLGMVLIGLIGCQGGPAGTVDIPRAIKVATLVVGTPATATMPGTGISGAYEMLKVLYPEMVDPESDARVTLALAQAAQLLPLLSPLADDATNARTLDQIFDLSSQALSMSLGFVQKITANDPATAKKLQPIVLAFDAAAMLMPIIRATVDQVNARPAPAPVPVPAK